jgi:hypothetical protein
MRRASGRPRRSGASSPTYPSSWAAITNKIRAAIFGDSAIRLARNVDGVSSVTNDLQLK